MSFPLLTWIIRPDESLVVEWFCSNEGDTRFFTVDDVKSAYACLVATAMTCTCCGASDFMSRPVLQLPPLGYAVSEAALARNPRRNDEG